MPMKTWITLVCLVFSVLAQASELSPTPLSEIERVRKRLYPGGRDEEDLKVLASLPEAMRKTDERVIQKDVYKSMFNQELVDEADEGAEPEVEN